MKDKEQVLVCRSEVIGFEGISSDLNQVLNAKCRFIYRDKAETDPHYKQIIPYAILHYQGKLLAYWRGEAGEEKRLIGQRSIGIGGHVNLIDTRRQVGCLCDGAIGISDILNVAVIRELEEELIFDLTSIENMTAIGLVNEDCTELGQIHVGIIYRVNLRNDRIFPREAAINNIEFIDPKEVDIREYEGWSQICLDNISFIL